MNIRSPKPAARVFLFVSLFLFFFFFLLAETPVQGRAGGGHSYSGGSSSSSSSRRSSSSSSSSSSRSSSRSGSSTSYSTRSFPTGRSSSLDDDRLSNDQTGFYVAGTSENADNSDARNMVVGLFFVLVSMALLEKVLGIRPEPVMKYVPNAALDVDVQDRKNRERAMIYLRQRDPDFKEPPFLERVGKAFAMIQEAWSRQDLKKVQAFLSDAVFERFSLQIDDMRRDRITDVMKNLMVIHSKVVRIDTDSHFDTMQVLVRAKGVNYRANLDTGAFIEGSRIPEEFTEVWSFVRRLGSKTLQKSGLIEGFCPNCAAAIEVSRTAICKSCNSFLRSGEYDWVLSEITQTCEWSGKEPGEIPGLKAFQAADPGFNVQHLEDRASMIFWRRIDCFRKGTVEPLLKCSTGPYADSFAGEIAPDHSGKRSSFVNPAVGSVEVLLVSREEPMDKVFVEIRWSGEPIRIDSAGRKVSGTGYSSVSHHLYVLVRKNGAQTDTRLSLSSSHCPGCGAAETSAADSVCPYCNSAFNDGSKEWILNRITSTGSQEFTALRKSVMNAGGPVGAGRPAQFKALPGAIRSPADSLRWLASMMASDSVVSPAELQTLRVFAQKQQIKSDKVDEVVKAAQAGGALPELPKDPGQVRDLMRLLVSMALCDGMVSQEEFQMLRSAGKSVRITDPEINQMIQREKNRLQV